MKATAIAAHEKSFRETGMDSNGKKHLLTPVTVGMGADPSGPLALMECKRQNGDSSFYFKEAVPKKRIVLHYTMGYLKGDIATLTRPTEHVSVPFVIARDGTIYNLWESKYWSYHLGPGCVGGNTAMSQSSIGIELSNIGPLKKIGENLVTTYDDNDVYCALSDTKMYTKMPQLYRKYGYYATFTEAQYKSLITLLRFLTKKYNIPRQFIGVDKRYLVYTDDASATAATGIISHVNVRGDGKTDIGAAFEWDKVITGVQQ